jgi:hypothetical protein
MFAALSSSLIVDTKCIIKNGKEEVKTKIETGIRTKQHNKDCLGDVINYSFGNNRVTPARY